jgi:hypothetical protein
MKTYIILFYHEEISEDELASYLDARPEVLNWVTPLPNTIFIVSKRTSTVIARLIEKEFPDSLFIVSEYYKHNSDGLLSEEMWDFLNDPQSA